jgi:hypothetical protein
MTVLVWYPRKKRKDDIRPGRIVADVELVEVK